MSRLLLLLSVLALAACDTGAGGSSATPRPTATPTASGAATPATQASSGVCQNLTRTALNEMSSPPPIEIDASKAYAARVNTSRGAFSIALNAQAAPVTVNNFVCLAKAHYYDNLTFHRVVPQFVVQGGDPLGNGTGGPKYKLPNETNPTPWKAGSLGMASNAAGVSGSQFFVALDDSTAASLATSGVYNQFGKVSDGFDVVQKIQKGDTINSVEISVQ